MDNSEQKIYLEIYLEAVVGVPESELKEVEGKIASAISHIFKKHKSARISTQIHKYTEEDLFMSLMQSQRNDDSYDN